MPELLDDPISLLLVIVGMVDDKIPELLADVIPLLVVSEGIIDDMTVESVEKISELVEPAL